MKNKQGKEIILFCARWAYTLYVYMSSLPDNLQFHLQSTRNYNRTIYAYETQPTSRYSCVWAIPIKQLKKKP